jgi:hypothetical protein
MDATSLGDLMDGVAKVLQQMELEEAIAMDEEEGASTAMQIPA